MEELSLLNQASTLPDQTYAAPGVYMPAQPISPAPYAPPEQVPIKQASTYLTPETKVSDQLRNLLQTDSPLLQLADTRAREQANKMGLLSSSLAVGTGQREATKQMLPIASQDAQTAATLGHQQQQAEAQTALQQQEGFVQAALAKQKMQDEAQLLGVQGGITASLQQMSDVVKQSMQQRELATQYALAEMDRNLKLSLQTMDQNFKTSLAQMDITNKEKTTLADSANSLAQIMMQEITNIQRDPNIKGDAQNKAIAAIEQMYQANLNSLAAIYNVDVSWDLGGSLASATYPTPTGTTPTGTTPTGTTPTATGVLQSLAQRFLPQFPREAAGKLLEDHWANNT